MEQALANVFKDGELIFKNVSTTFTIETEHPSGLKELYGSFEFPFSEHNIEAADQLHIALNDGRKFNIVISSINVSFNEKINRAYFQLT